MNWIEVSNALADLTASEEGLHSLELSALPGSDPSKVLRLFQMTAEFLPSHILPESYWSTPVHRSTVHIYLYSNPSHPRVERENQLKKAVL